MTTTTNENPPAYPFKSLFKELHAYFHENQARKQKPPFSITRYFPLLALSESDLFRLGSASDRIRYRSLQERLIQQIEQQLHPDLDDLHLQNVRSLRKIMIYFKKIERLLPPSIIQSVPLLSEIKNDIVSLKKSETPSLYLIPDSFIENAFSLLTTLSELEKPKLCYSKKYHRN